MKIERSPEPVGAQAPSVRQTEAIPRSSHDFRTVLQRELSTHSTDAGTLKLSAHARGRLQTAGIRLGAEALRRIEQAVDRVAEKGGREALVLIDGLALVVSVRHRTIITAVEPSRAKENVFTNIDSAAIT